MKKADLEKLEKIVTAEVVKRRGLGEYSADATGIILFGEALMMLIRHVNERTPNDPKDIDFAKPAKGKR